MSAQYDGLFQHSAMLRDIGIVFIGPVELDPNFPSDQVQNSCSHWYSILFRTLRLR